MQRVLASSTSRVAAAPLARRAVPVAPRRAVVVKAGGGIEQVGSAYANALVEAAQSKGALDAVHADVDALQTLLRDSADVKDFLENPTVNIDKKKELLARVGREAGLNGATLNFLNLLLDNDRFVAAPAIFDAFELQYCALTDTQVATVRSAVKLEQEQQFLIAKKLQELTGSKNIKLKPTVDPALIAGFVVEYGSSQVDLSVKGQLDRISSELVAAE